MPSTANQVVAAPGCSVTGRRERMVTDAPPSTATASESPSRAWTEADANTTKVRFEDAGMASPRPSKRTRSASQKPGAIRVPAPSRSSNLSQERSRSFEVGGPCETSARSTSVSVSGVTPSLSRRKRAISIGVPEGRSRPDAEPSVVSRRPRPGSVTSTNAVSPNEPDRAITSDVPADCAVNWPLEFTVPAPPAMLHVTASVRSLPYVSVTTAENGTKSPTSTFAPDGVSVTCAAAAGVTTTCQPEPPIASGLPGVATCSETVVAVSS